MKFITLSHQCLIYLILALHKNVRWEREGDLIEVVDLSEYLKNLLVEYVLIEEYFLKSFFETLIHQCTGTGLQVMSVDFDWRFRL